MVASRFMSFPPVAPGRALAGASLGAGLRFTTRSWRLPDSRATTFRPARHPLCSARSPRSPTADAGIAIPEGRFASGDSAGDTVRLTRVSRHFSQRDFTGTVDVGQTTRARDALARDITRSALLVVGLLGLLIVAMIASATSSVSSTRSSRIDLSALSTLGRPPCALPPAKERPKPRAVSLPSRSTRAFSARQLRHTLQEKDAPRRGPQGKDPRIEKATRQWRVGRSGWSRKAEAEGRGHDL